MKKILISIWESFSLLKQKNPRMGEKEGKEENLSFGRQYLQLSLFVVAIHIFTCLSLFYPHDIYFILILKIICLL